MNEDRTRPTAKALGWEHKPGGFQVCQACAEAKVKKKNLPAKTEHIKASKEKPQIFLDISTLKDSSVALLMQEHRRHQHLLDKFCTRLKKRTA